MAEEGQEWSFVYVLPQEEGGPIKLDTTMSLQIGWINSQGYFCAASEIIGDVGEKYDQSKISTLPNHKFLEYTKGSPEYEVLPDVMADNRPLKFMLEVYVDNYTSIAIA